MRGRQDQLYGELAKVRKKDVGKDMTRTQNETVNCKAMMETGT